MPEVESNELSLDQVVEVAPEELTDEQKTYLQDNAGDLTDEQKETFKDVLTKKEEPIKDEDFETEVRKAPLVKKEKGDERDEGDGEIDSDDEKAISKMVAKQIKPVQETLKRVQEMEDRAEVDSFIAVRPEFAKYRGVILKHVQHPSYANIPIHNIAAMVSAKDMQALGAAKEREAARKAAETKGGGQMQRKVTSGKTDWGKISSEDFAVQRAKVMGQGG